MIHAMRSLPSAFVHTVDIWLQHWNPRAVRLTISETDLNVKPQV